MPESARLDSRCNPYFPPLGEEQRLTEHHHKVVALDLSELEEKKKEIMTLRLSTHSPITGLALFGGAGPVLIWLTGALSSYSDSLGLPGDNACKSLHPVLLSWFTTGATQGQKLVVPFSSPQFLFL